MIMDAVPDLWQTPTDMKDFLMSGDEVSAIMNINAQALHNCKIDITNLVHKRDKLQSELSRVKENVKNLQDENRENQDQIDEMKAGLSTYTDPDTDCFDVGRLDMIISSIVSTEDPQQMAAVNELKSVFNEIKI